MMENKEECFKDGISLLLWETIMTFSIMVICTWELINRICLSFLILALLGCGLHQTNVLLLNAQEKNIITQSLLNIRKQQFKKKFSMVKDQLLA